MAKVVVKAKAKKVKRKFPVEIIAPEYLNNVSLGKSEVTDLGALIGKSVKMNLMYVTDNVKNQNIRLVFKVIEASSGLAKTQIKEYSQIPYYLGRFVKKGTNLVEDTFTAKSKDGIECTIKPFIVTKIKGSEIVLRSLRARTREVLRKEVESRTYDEFISTVIAGRLQTGIRTELKKVIPLKSFEFKKIALN